MKAIAWSKMTEMSGSDASDLETKEPGVELKDYGEGKTTDIGLLSEVEHFSNGSFSSDDIEIIATHLDDHTVEESRDILEEAIKYHHNDPVLSQRYRQHMISMVQGPLEGQSEDEWEALLKFDAFLIKDWSIYPEVRAVTRPLDEEDDEEYETLRVYLISVCWSCAGSVLATFFAPRFPPISINSVALQLLIAYTGRACYFLPKWSFPIGFGNRVRLGGGKWTYKEQMLASCGMGVGNQSPYSLYAVLAMANDNFYGIKEAGGFGFIILLTLSSNLMGFGLAGIYRTFLVYPVKMVWYGVLPTLKMSRALVAPEKRETVNGWRLKGWEFFWLFSFAELGWYWITDFVFAFLSVFDWMAWIDHTNNNLLSICGVNTGLGFSPLPSLDFSTFGVSSLVTPFFAVVSNQAGMLISMFAVIALFWTNGRFTAFFPINSNELYDNTGNVYDVSQVLNSENKLDEAKYQQYSLPYWSAGNLVAYGSFFMFYPAMIVYAALNYGGIMIESGRIFFATLLHPTRAINSFDDRFTRAQRKYKEAPEWWYLLMLFACIGLGIACVEHYSFTETPVWTIFFGIGLSAFFMIPTGMLYATTNQPMDINVLFELVIGVTNSGNANALMIAKVYATNFLTDTDMFISNLKTGHYCGIAPRPMFRIQIVNAIANSFAQSGLMVWQASSNGIPNMCDIDNTEKFTCQGVRTYFNAAVQWGTLSPKRVFHSGSGPLEYMKWCFLIGAFYPVPFWLVRRFLVPYARRHNWGGIKEGGSRFRNHWAIRNILSLEWTHNINEIIIITGGIQWAPTNWMYILPLLYLGLIFQVFIRRYYPRWWEKYNYLLYAAITVGYSYGGLFQFFATSYRHIAHISWWGNDTGVSLLAGPRLNATLDAPEGYFGPRKGHFPK